MTILLGSIALTRLQAVEVDEPRQLVELRAPGAGGSVFQNLGRSAVRLTLVGIFLGEQALRDIEVLRQAHAEASPLSFSGDVAVGSEITDVVIERFEVHQLPGHAFRYEYRLRVSEWTEPPRSPADDVARVDVGVAVDADQWAEQSQQLTAGLSDPAALARALGADPSLLDRVDVGELAQAVLGALGGLDAADFGHLLAAVAGVDPTKAIALLEALDEADSLEDLLRLVVEEGIDLVEDVTGLDLSEATAAVQAFVGGIDFIARVRDVTTTAEALLDALAGFDLRTPPATTGRDTPTSSAADVVARATALLEAIEGLVASTRAMGLPSVAAELGEIGRAHV